jgi:ABC-type cobalt transport system substrate-binding protein
MKPLFLIVALFTVMLNTCYREYKYNTATVPETPVNMEEINSVYDDYNSTSPIKGESSPLCFSSNRSSSGGNFDLEYKFLSIIFSKLTGKLYVGEDDDDAFSETGLAYKNIIKAFWVVNSTDNELGPYLIPQGSRYRKVGSGGFEPHQKFILLYATDEQGNLDIRFTHNLTSDDYSEPANIPYLNSEKDDAYPTLNSDTSAFYFCSNRETNFDIYKADIPMTTRLFSSLSSQTEVNVVKMTELSSDKDDKCPFVIGNLMVFASDRTGGYGGFDLYYSTFTGGVWTAPVNFGDKINTQYDEYRPIVKPLWEFTNDFMLFSSNRPGGSGGYDLYYAGIKKMTGFDFYNM